MNLFTSVEDIQNETGLVFGALNTPFLRVAMRYATLEESGALHRKVAIITAANPAAVKSEYSSKWATEGIAYVKYHDDLDLLLSKLENEPTKPEAVVFHDVGQYSRYIIEKLVGSASPEQSHWGVMARTVRNDLLRLTGIIPVVYVTVDVVQDEKTKVNDLNMTPFLKNSLLGDFGFFAYVTQTGDETFVQTDKVLALKFRSARPAGETVEGNSRKPVNLLRKVGAK